MKLNKQTIIIVGVLLILLAYFGVQELTVYGYNKTIKEIKPNTYTGDIGDYITVKGTVYTKYTGTYCIDVYTPDYSKVTTIQTKKVVSGGSTFWDLNGQMKITTYGTHHAKLTNCVDKTYGLEPDFTIVSKSAPTPTPTPTVTTPVQPTPTPTPFVQCNDYCVGTTLYTDGVNVNGQCQYEKELNSPICGYVAPTPTPTPTPLPDDGDADGQADLTTTVLLMGLIVVGLGAVYLLIKRR
jgi:hypothetical protein